MSAGSAEQREKIMAGIESARASGTRIGRPPKESGYVLIKGYHDSGVIDGVYGPFTSEMADWLLANFCDGGINNWTKIMLSKLGL